MALPGSVRQQAENLFAVEQPDVSYLNGRDAANRPHQLDVVGFRRVGEKAKTAFPRKTVSLAQIAAAARRDDVRPLVVSAARKRHDVIPCQGLAVSEVSAVPPAVLAGVVVASKQEGVGDLSAKAARNMDVADQPNHHRRRKLGGLRSEWTALVHFEGHRLAIDYEAKGPADRYDRQRLERRVECETTHEIESTSCSAAKV